MWIGTILKVLSKLTVPEQLLIAPVYPWCFIYKLHPCGGSSGDPMHEQSGLQGNVTSFSMNTDEVIEMLKGVKMPWPASILALVLTITYVRVGQLPQNWLKSTFWVQCHAVLEALIWLIQNNKGFSSYIIDEEILQSLPEDDIPVEIIASVHQETRTDILHKEHDTYVPDPHEFLFGDAWQNPNQIWEIDASNDENDFEGEQEGNEIQHSKIGTMYL